LISTSINLKEFKHQKNGLTGTLFLCKQFQKVRKISIKIQILYPKSNAFHKARSGTVHQFGHQQMDTLHLRKHAPNFAFRHDNRGARMKPCPCGFDLTFDGHVKQ